MKLSKNTLDILRNFAILNGNIFIPAGNIIKSMSVIGNALASVTVEETFDKDVSIYDLSELLSVLNIAPDGEITLHENRLDVKWGKSKVKYAFADQILMRDAIAASKKNVNYPVVDVEFELTGETLSSLHKASSILKAPYVGIYSNEGKVNLKVFDKALVNSNVFVVETEVDTTEDFEVVLDITNLKLLGGDYTVSLSRRNIIRFAHQSSNLLYYVTADTASVWK
jgi:hypothetical protein